MNNTFLAEAELLHRFRQAMAEVNAVTGSQYTFIHGTSDEILERRAEEWNRNYTTARAVGECEGTSATGLPHRFVANLHQDEFGPTFRLVERFWPLLEYRTDAASIFTIDCDVWPTIRPIIAPDVRTDEPCLMLAGLQSSGPFDRAALARAIRDLHACKIAVIRRYQHREGPDHWRAHREMLSRLRGP